VDTPTLSNTDLAFERTMLAENRTLMAWIRTAISMISFGFTIYKFFEEARKNSEGSGRILTPRLVGMIMISFGLLSLSWGLAEYYTAVKRLRESNTGVRRSNISTLAILILFFGLALFLAALFRQ
jgi:putative membrane protein